jgi:hypothetical protein
MVRVGCGPIIVGCAVTAGVLMAAWTAIVAAGCWADIFCGRSTSEVPHSAQNFLPSSLQPQ